MDAADLVNREQLRLEQRFEALVLGQQAKAAAAKDEPSAHRCVECDDDIPEGRRQAIQGVKLCVVCQQRIER